MPWLLFLRNTFLHVGHSRHSAFNEQISRATKTDLKKDVCPLCSSLCVVRVQRANKEECSVYASVREEQFILSSQAFSKRGWGAPPIPLFLHMYGVVCARQVFLRDARLCATTEFQMNLIDTSKSYPMKELTTRIKDKTQFPPSWGHNEKFSTFFCN